MSTSNTRRKHVCILPSTVPLSARSNSRPNQFLRLPHPRTRQPTLYLPFVADETQSTPDGILEVQRVTPEEENKRSWFVEEEILSDGTLTILTPFDPLFLLISLLSLLPTHYLSYEDLWESLATIGIPISSTNMREGEEEEVDEEERDETMSNDILKLGELKCVRGRLQSICETQIHESTTLYRLSLPLVTTILKAKVDSLTNPDIGIFGELESVTLGTKKETIVVEKIEEGSESLVEELKDATDVREYPTVSRGLAREGLGDGQGVSLEIQMETRTKSAILILSNYLLPEITHSLTAAYSFKALNTHLSTITTSSVLSATYLPGRGSSNADAGGSTNGFGSAAAKEKKRKADAKGSRGVEELKKVNTKGMKSIAEMFKMGPKKK